MAAVKLVTLSPVTVTVANTAVPLTSDPIWVTSVTIQASFTNVSKITVGDLNVTSSNGIEVPPGDTCTIEGTAGFKGPEDFVTNEIFINSTTSGDSCRVSAWKRRDKAT